MTRPVAWILVGPTAVGKSDVAHLLAQQRGAMVLSADAMAVYRGMDIGTAKPDARMRGEVPYRGIDLVEPADVFSVGAYCRHAQSVVNEAARENRPLLVAGGTGLYVSSLVRGLATPSPVDPERRSHWERLWQAEGLEGLQRALRQLDAGALDRLADPRNPRRLIRALERAEAGTPPDQNWRRPMASRIVGLRMDPGLLRARIQQRAQWMFASGILDEAARLRRHPHPLSHTAAQAIGYAEAFDVLDQRLSVAEAVARTAARTWQLARRQMTWFRRQLPVSWIDVGAADAREQLAAQVSRQWEQDGPTALFI